MTKPVQRLAQAFAPAAYILDLDLTQQSKRTFNGKVTITGELTANSRQISLHGKDLAIKSAEINGEPATITINKPDDEIVLSVNHDLPAGKHNLVLDFSGAITDPMHGLYPCYFKLDGQDEELLATQFESHHAREVFPCIDEPVAKATFDLTLKTRPKLTVLANTAIKSQNEQNQQTVTTFETTPHMSTYLLAFAVGKLGYTETTNANGVTIRAYSTPDKVEQTRFALEHAAKSLDFYDDYFNLPYPLTKCDMIALPDFSSGAMENWGLITYRESCMLVDEQNTSAETKQYVATVVSHELAHQWFGNLVTMQWWDDLWLNESFANWMEYVVLEHFYPEWQVWEQFGATEQQVAFTRDGLASVQAVQQRVNHPEEIRSMFDGAIVYAKGACLLRMLNEYLGAETFRDGLRIYMQRHKYSNTTTKNLWTALSEASGKDVASFMDAWVEQPGHPLVSIGCKNGQAELHQKRFYSNPVQAPKNDETLWPLPLLSSVFPNNPLLEESHTTLPTPSNALCMLNKGGTGFYHVRYDQTTLQTIIKNVQNDELSAADRQRLLLDSVALTKAGADKTTSMLSLLAAYKNETNYSVWLAMITVINSLKILIDNDSTLKPHLQKYVLNLVQQEFKQLGWEHKKDEPYFDELLRPMLIGCMIYAEDPTVLDRAINLFNNASKPEDLPADIRSGIYSAAVRHLGQPAFEKLLEWYKQTASAEERINLCAGITNTRDKAIAEQILKLITTKTVKLQDVGFWFAYLIRNPHGRDQAWDWMKNNWQWINTNFSSDMHYTDFPRYSASGFSRRDQLQDYSQFFTPKLNEPALTRAIKQGQEDIEARALWRERDLAEVKEFLNSND